MAVTPSTFWNSISLRTKITGVTVLMLTFGLIIAGIGTMTVLRSYLLNGVDSQLKSAYTDISPFLGSGASALIFKLDDVASAPKEYYVALLDSSGTLSVSNWGSQPTSEEPSVSGMTAPSLDAQAQNPIYVLNSTGTKTEWHAAVRTVNLQDGTYGTLIIASSLEKT